MTQAADDNASSGEYIDLYDKFRAYIGGVYIPGDAEANKYPTVTKKSEESLCTVSLTTTSGAGTPPVLTTTVTAGSSATTVFNFTLRSKRGPNSGPVSEDNATDECFYKHFTLTSENMDWAAQVFADRYTRSMLLTFVSDCYLELSPTANDNAQGGSEKSNFTLTFVEPGLLEFEQFQYYAAVFSIEDKIIHVLTDIAGTNA